MSAGAEPSARETFLATERDAVFFSFLSSAGVRENRGAVWRAKNARACLKR